MYHQGAQQSCVSWPENNQNCEKGIRIPVWWASAFTLFCTFVSQVCLPKENVVLESSLVFPFYGLLLHPVQAPYLVLETEDFEVPQMICQHPQPRAVFAFLYFRSPLLQLPVSSQLSCCGKAQGKQLSFPHTAQRLIFIFLSLPQPYWRNIKHVTCRKKPPGLYFLSLWSWFFLGR